MEVSKLPCLAVHEFEPHIKSMEIKINSVRFGGEEPIVIADVSLTESEEEIATMLKILTDCHIPILHVGTPQPCESRLNLLERRDRRLSLLRQAANRSNLLIVAEVEDSAHLAFAAEHADLLQIEMHHKPNLTLLRQVAQRNKPVVLKRGIAMQLEELLRAAEYLHSAGTSSVILCEQGIRTFQDYAPVTLDLSVIPMLKELSHLPVLAAPHRAAERSQHVLPLALASITAGADGLIIQVCPTNQQETQDRVTSLRSEQIREWLARLRALYARLHRKPSHEPVQH